MSPAAGREGAGGTPAWLPAAAVAAVFLVYLLLLADAVLWHPGYAYGDERLVVCRLQDLREGAPFLWRFGHGCLTLGLQSAWVGLAGAGLASLHVPELALTLFEWIALALLARRWFGEEAACWSVLALVLCSQAWVGARSLLAFQALPAETLLIGLLATRVRGGAAALAWGLVASVLFLDYDGAFIAVPGMFCACLGMEPAFRRRFPPALAGLALGAAFLALRQHADWRFYAAVRLGDGPASAADLGLSGRLIFLKELFTGGPNLPYLGVTAWPAWAPWAWLGLAAGLWRARRLPALALALWAVVGVLVTQCVHSAYGLPIHRLAAVAPAVALLSGLGFAALRARMGRHAWVLLLLVLAGAGSEGWAWCRHQWAFGPELYDRCEGLQRVREVYARDLAGPSTRVLTQFDGMFDADARFVLDRAPWGAGVRPAEVLAVVPAGYAPAAESLGLRGDWLWVEKGLEPAFVVRTGDAKAEARLEAVSAALVPLVGAEEDAAAARLARCEAWLDSPVRRDPWTLSAVLESDLQDAVQAGGAGRAQQARLVRARLLSDAPWMVLARAAYPSQPRAALGYCSRALALDPRDGEALLIEAGCLRAVGDARAGQVQAYWVKLRSAGLAWRHTL